MPHFDEAPMSTWRLNGTLSTRPSDADRDDERGCVAMPRRSVSGLHRKRFQRRGVKRKDGIGLHKRAERARTRELVSNGQLALKAAAVPVASEVLAAVTESC